MTRSDRIAEALFDCVAAAPSAEQQELFAALKAFREEVWRTYRSVKRQPFAAKMIEAIEEAEKFVAENDDPMREIVKANRGVAPDSE